ncbi:KptA family-domain-containing protein [Clohesyomyces aquaticus]|uniref:2'-phosphotransferase n=1 Tax=Clohesyomyces aquaticus TaxID=1231657 RepID=A0A1Y1ZQL7_9PLEO|nr:KptA family-domain-containing protein [Clohesyomyces aquaticus]
MSSRRGGGRGGRNPKDLPRDQQVSRKVSWLLRHGADQEGLKLGKGGYVSVSDALNTRALKSLKITFPELRSMVASNDKQRFSMILATALDAPDSTTEPTPPTASAFDPIPESDDPSDYLIRANQGHSIKVDSEGLLTPITASAGNIPETCVHGTDERAWNLILKSGGLRKMSRTHIHFAAGLPKGFTSIDMGDGKGGAESEAPPVISGMRNSSTVLIYVDVKKALEKGIQWFVSENGVILTEGDESGVLGTEFFTKVENRKGGRVLMMDGKVPEGVEVDVEAWEREVGGGGGRGGRGGRKGRGGRGGGGKGKMKANDDDRDMLAGFE